MDSKISKMYDMLSTIKLKIVMQSILVGLMVGVVISIYRLIIEHIVVYTHIAYVFMLHHKIYIILGLIVLIILGLIVGAMVENESMISGSGIPQIEGILTGRFDEPSPVKVLIFKFVGGIISIGAGLSLGIEGPSIQLGATVANLYANIAKRLKLEKRFLISSGAGAGLAAAFNAPFAGVMFVLEEAHKKFTPTLFVSAIAATISADIVTWIFCGTEPILSAIKTVELPLKYYPYLIVLGLIVGIAGVIYNKTLVKTSNIYGKINIPVKYRIVIPFVCAMFFGLFMPQVLGGGSILINEILSSGLMLKIAIILLIAKFIFSMISFCGGTPGGILFPLLTLGALLGVIFGDVVVMYMGVSPIFMTNFVLFAMAAMFAAIVRAPITGLMLVCEMSGSFSQFTAIALVCGVAYLVAELLRCEPIYESLSKMRTSKLGDSSDVVSSNTEIIVSYIIEMGSEIVGKKLKDIKLIDNTLIISIVREGNHLIPDGDTIMMSGDTINVMVSENREINLRARLETLCVHCDCQM